MEKELQFIKKVSKEVSELGGRVYYVGGYVRDKFLNKENKDIDVEVYNIPLDRLKSVLSKHGEVVEVGESFGILMVKGYEIDFSLPRTETKQGDKHTDFKVKIDSTLDVETATKRRDFTINSVLQDVLTEEYIDYYNGISDIKKGVIRYVNKDTFIEDELRVLRACQFASRFNFKIDDNIKEVIQGFTYTSLSKERIYEELNKALLKSEKPSIAFNYLLELGVIEIVFPELYDLVNCEQGKKHHPEGDVWTHTMLVLDECARLKDKSKNPLGLMYSGLCHDLGKPLTQRVESADKITFYSHDKRGVDIAENLMRKLTNETKIIKYVKDLTEYHMLGHKLLELRDRKLKELLTKVDIEELLLLTEADEKGRGKSELLSNSDFNKKQEEVIKRISDLSDGGFGKVTPYFTGKDLIALGYSQGKEMGDVLKEAYIQQINGKSRDRIEVMLINKIRKKKSKTTLSLIVEEELSKLMGEDKLNRERVLKRLRYFKYLCQKLSKDENQSRFKKTKGGTPYLEVLNKDKTYKYLITPVYVLKMSKDYTKKEVIFSVLDDKIEDRLPKFKTVLNNINPNQAKTLSYMLEQYGRLPNTGRTGHNN